VQVTKQIATVTQRKTITLKTSTASTIQQARTTKLELMDLLETL
jgi:hypothetical protein